MSKLLLAGLLLLLSPAWAGSWHYNDYGGFGFLEPEGWRAEQNGRSSRLRGPETDTDRSELFVASDWQSEIRNLSELEAKIRRSEAGNPEPFQLSGLEGFRLGSGGEGKYFLLRQAKNVILVEFVLRGSKAQREEGALVLSSLAIRTTEAASFPSQKRQ